MRRTAAGYQSPGNGDVAKGYRFWFGKALASDAMPYPRTLLASGFLTSTARDMGAYLIANLGGGPRIVSASGLAELHRKGPNTGERYGYAMGWATDSQYPDVLTHEGETPEHTSAMGIDIQHGWGYALLLNVSDALTGPVILDLAPQVANYMRGVPPVALIAKRIWSPVLIALFALSGIQCAIGIWLVRRVAWPTPATTRRRVVMVLAPLAAGLSLTAVFMVWIPEAVSFNLSGLLLYVPDAGWLLVINGVFAVSLGAVLAIKFIVIRDSSIGD